MGKQEKIINGTVFFTKGERLLAVLYPRTIKCFAIIVRSEREVLERTIFMFFFTILKEYCTMEMAILCSEWELIELYDKIGMPYLDLDKSEVEKKINSYH